LKFLHIELNPLLITVVRWKVDSGWAIAEKINSNNKNYKIIYSENTKDVVAKFIRIVHRKLRDFL